MKLEELDSQLEKNQLSGFWRTRVPGHTAEAPYLWKWESLLDGLLKASETIGIEQAERRAIRLVNPQMPMKATSHTLQVTFYYFCPGTLSEQTGDSENQPTFGQSQHSKPSQGSNVQPIGE